MITAEQARQIALSMPEAEEREHMSHPDFRVRGKIFATLWPDEAKAVVFADPDSHSDLISEYGGVFSTNGWSEKYGALNVHLEKVSESHFRQLVKASWKRKAPKTLVEQLA